MRWRISISAAWVLGALGTTAWATEVKYDLSHVSGSTWQFDFSVNNNNLGAPVELFALFFAQGSYDHLSVLSQPANWTPEVFPPVPILHADGEFDFFEFTHGIGPGTKLGGFDVQVDFLGQGTPRAPPFAVVDPGNFSNLDSGLATPSQPIGVDEPGTLALLGAGLLAAAALRTARRRRA